MDKKLATTIGAAARAARTRLELTQADVAERIDVATEVYGRLERGGMLPSVQTLLKLCHELHVSADELLGLASHGTGSTRSSAEPPPSPQERPEVRRLLRTVRQLEPSKVKLLGLVANALGRR
ncbi:helix-turn-helix transcriptional regulator [Pyxidicoccus fallax]|uniref:Helix-turn-helix transcriptional regulator n=1 Tax=Pyxidicoccus fallax TaxID=394095 RepID=A0A848LYI8_9BACT|nr:helix-turn-helix transcriptional regulator [Pyxidicoccus fallax]NMO22602.1 helix-turn-helix transcriptional regulator [Pyxidicoccus fallax]NPC84622.1 helix-turn-helix transcriptional regulator [Pyxidicoccus fallax]